MEADKPLSPTARRILEAAQSLIARSGYAAVSMRSIAEAVGVQAGALYNHFDGKQRILQTLMERHLEETLAAWRAACPADPDPRLRLEAFARFHVHHHITRREAVFIAAMELRALEPEGLARVLALRRAYEEALAEILREGQAQGRFTVPDLRVTTMALLALLTGVNVWFREEGRLSGEAVETIHAELVLRGLGLAPDAD